MADQDKHNQGNNLNKENENGNSEVGAVNIVFHMTKVYFSSLGFIKSLVPRDFWGHILSLKSETRISVVQN